MRIVIRWHECPRGAGAAFFALAGLSAVILGMLAGSLMEHASRYTDEILAACESAWTILRSYALPGPALFPAAILIVILSSGGLTLLRQLYATRRLVSGTRRQRVPLPERLLKAASALDLADRLDLVADERVYSFCYGLLWPRICLTTGLLELLDDEELDALLRHEQYHLQHHDPLKVLLSQTWASGLFFLPLAQDLRDRYMRAKEMEADDITAADGRGEIPLASALLKVLTSERRLRHGTLAAIGAFSMSVTEERIERLINPRPFPTRRQPRPGRTLVSALAVALIVVASLAPFVGPSTARAENECSNHVSYNL